MVSEGIYYSKLLSVNKFLWAFIDSRDSDPAHFSLSGCVTVIHRYVGKNHLWSHAASSEKYLVIPEKMIKW